VLIPIEELRERLEYDPETGVLRWRKGRRQRAGYLKPSGYREVEWRRKGAKALYPLAHRVAWTIAIGAWPSDEIGHRNGNRDDNRLANLREATSAENKQNRAPIRGKSWSLLGVSKTPRCRGWRAQMNNHYIGTFDTPEEAHQAYLAAKAERHAFQPQPRE
jgi:hypothetical protein